MVEKIKVILAHGNGSSSPHDHWFPYVAAELSKLGCQVIARQFPDAMLAPESRWVPFLKHDLGADERTIIIGHSSGAVAAMRFAEKNRLLGTVLVGACHTDLGMESERRAGYYSRPWDWDPIKKNQQWIVQFASTDDPWIPIEEPRFIRDHLDSEYIEFHDQGHFGCDRNKTSFPELVHAVKVKLK